MTGNKIADTTYIPLIDAQMVGYIKLTITNFDNNDLPKIKKGSMIYYAGNLYNINSLTEISGDTLTGDIYVVFNGTGFAFSDEVSSWDADNFYLKNSDGRIILKLTKSGSNYKNKRYVTNWRQDDNY
jgi:hypothetical protein